MSGISLEKIDILRERTGVSYREAKELLEKHNGNVIDALIEIEGRKQSKWTEEFSVRSSELIEKVKELVREGNVNKIRVKHDGRTLVEIPVALGAIGAFALPQLAALGVLVAVFKRCTIEVIRSDDPEATEQTPPSPASEEESNGGSRDRGEREVRF